MRALSAPRRGARQRGVVLFVALIVLVIMALTGLAMIRQSGVGLSIAGNVGFRQNALSAADLGTEAAVAWWEPLRDTPAMNNTNATAGYFADWGDLDPKRRAGDPTLYDWTDANSRLVIADDGTGNAVRYVIERLCLTPGVGTDAPGQQCVQTVVKDGHDQSGSCANYPNPCDKRKMIVQYRVSSRVIGPRNTVSYIQVMLTSAG